MLKTKTHTCLHYILDDLLTKSENNIINKDSSSDESDIDLNNNLRINYKDPKIVINNNNINTNYRVRDIINKILNTNL